MRKLALSFAIFTALASPGAAQMPAPMPMPAPIPTPVTPMPMPMPQAPSPMPVPSTNVSRISCPADALTAAQIAALEGGDLHAGNFNECVATLELYGMSRLSSCRACAEH